MCGAWGPEDKVRLNKMETKRIKAANFARMVELLDAIQGLAKVPANPITASSFAREDWLSYYLLSNDLVSEVRRFFDPLAEEAISDFLQERKH